MMRTEVLLCFLIFSLALLPIRRASQEVEDESEFNYVEGSEKGPERWGEIKPEWRTCANGSMQSPIDLKSDRVVLGSHLGRLKRSYKPSNATLKNRGHDIMLSWEGGAGSIRINGTDYVLQQCHWHSPSEHAINGRRFALEMHLVHESQDGRVAVVGILYTVGRPDTFLSSILSHLGAVLTEDAEKAIGVVDPKAIKLGSRKYYRYVGSLTTPPCTQNVQWTIIHKVRTVAREQVRLLRDSVNDEAESNARPLQRMNGRIVQLYRPDENNPQDGRP